MVKLLISVPKRLKVKLDALRKEGTSASGFIRSLLEREFKNRSTKEDPNGKDKNYKNEV
jgi:metal-responsive CopG/Arc/MetJ family transcriptional regulator